MLALVVSLSIIPIQQASESFTSSIVQIYKEDLTARFIFVTLAVFCFVSFLMVFGADLGYPKLDLLLTQIFLIAASLDVIRWHHRHVTSLLGSNEAINKLKDKIIRYITVTQIKVTLLAQVQRFFFNKTERQATPSIKLETVLYSKSNVGYGPVKKWIGELAETAIKSITNGETYRAELAIFAMSEVAGHYLKVRKDNLIIFIEENSFGVKGSDVHKILSPIYEHYKDINRISVLHENETTSICTIRALGNVAEYLNKLKSSRFSRNSAPLTYLPIGYLGMNVDIAQRKGLDDVSLQGCDILFQIVECAPKDVDIVEVHLSVINELYKIATMFLISGKGSLANRPLETMMKIIELLVKQKHFRVEEVIEQVLEKMGQLIPLAIKHEQIHGTSIVGLPMSPVYDLTQKFSIGYLVANLIDYIEQEKDNNGINPYGKFIKINKPIWRHFYSVGEKNDFGQSFLLWHIIQTIEHISNVFFNLFHKPSTTDTEFLKELEECFFVVFEFFLVSF